MDCCDKIMLGTKLPPKASICALRMETEFGDEVGEDVHCLDINLSSHLMFKCSRCSFTLLFYGLQIKLFSIDGTHKI